MSANDGNFNDDLLVFNGIDGSSGSYLNPQLSTQQIAKIARGEKLDKAELLDLQRKQRQRRQSNFGTIAGVDPNDLAQAGWGVVFAAAQAADEQQAVYEALTPLLRHRRAQASATKAERYREYKGPDGYRPGETKQQFLARLGAGPGPANPDKVPYYLLFVASPADIPFRIQYLVDVQYAVGRIYFDRVEYYANYASSVVAAETGQGPQAQQAARRATFFAVENPDDVATQLGRAHLTEPLANYTDKVVAEAATAGARQRDGGPGGPSNSGGNGHHPAPWQVERVMRDQATSSRLGDILRDPPALLFTASHGMGFPNGHENQLRYQGALLCSDWQGPKHGKLKRGDYFAGEDIAASADMRGMIGFHFACYGLGTPADDDFSSRAFGRSERKAIAPRAFVAELPQRMLSHPGGGALATIGHIDRAWGSSFLWMDAQRKMQTQRHLDVFESALRSLVMGKRAGFALEYFNNRYAELAADLSNRIEEIEMYDEEHPDYELAQMWIFQNDARNYAIFGDPAVHLGPNEAAEKVSQDQAAAQARARLPIPAVPPAPAETPDAQIADTQMAFEESTNPVASDRPMKFSDTSFSEPDEVTINRSRPTTPPLPDNVNPDFGLFGGDKNESGGIFVRFGAKVTDTLAKVVDDAINLEVKTYTSHARRLGAATDGQAAAGGGTQLRAFTRIALDGDTENYVPVDDAGAVDRELWSLHSEMVKQAQSYRSELIKTALALVTPLIKG